MTTDPVTSLSARTSDMRFSYRRYGTGGPPILLLHGWPQTAAAWRRVAPLLGVGFDVIVPDLPGFGNTSKPDAGFDKKTIARRLRELMQVLGLSRIAVAGHDIGGAVAYAYAAQWPDEISHLIFIESSLPASGQEEAMDVANGGSWHFGFNMAGDIAEELVRGKEYIFVDHLMRRESVGLFDADAVSPAEIETYARALAQPGALRCSTSYYRALPIDHEDNRIWGRTPLPMSVLAVGAEWGYGPASAATMRRVASRVDDVRMPNCGHYVPEERPAALAEAITTFLHR